MKRFNAIVDILDTGLITSTVITGGISIAARLQHKKNKGVRQSHASSWNLEVRDVWKVARHSPNRRVVACNGYSFKNTIVFILLQWDVWTIIKLKLKQASKEYQKEFHREKIQERLAKMFFSFISQFHKVRDDLKPI